MRRMRGVPRYVVLAVTAGLCVLASCTSPSLPPLRTPRVSNSGDVSVGSTPVNASEAAPTAPEPTVTPTSSTTGSSGALPKLADLEAPDKKPASETELLEQALNANSTPTMQQAIDVFSVSMATLPGASTPTLPAGGGFSATVAKALLASYYTQLTPDQRRVVDAFDGTVIASTGAGSHVLAAVGTGTAPSGSSSPSVSSASGDVGENRPGTTASTGGAGYTPSSAPPRTSPPGLRRAASAPSPTPGAHDIDLLQQTINDWFAYRPDLIGRVGGFELALSTLQPKDNRDMDSHPSPSNPTTA